VTDVRSIVQPVIVVAFIRICSAHAMHDISEHGVRNKYFGDGLPAELYSHTEVCIQANELAVVVDGVTRPVVGQLHNGFVDLWYSAIHAY
jgi:hypothetical protein